MLLSNAELLENRPQDVLDIHPAQQPAQGIGRSAQLFGGKLLALFYKLQTPAQAVRARRSRSRWRARVTNAPSVVPKKSAANFTSASTSSGMPSPRLAEIPNSTAAARRPRPRRDRSCCARSRPSRRCRCRTSPATASRPDRRAPRLHQPQHEVGVLGSRSRPAHAFLLDRIVGLANAGGVDHRDGIAVEIELHLDHVARRAGMRRDDRDLAARELIDQRRLADIRRARDRDHQAVAQTFSLSLCRKDFFDLAVQRFDRLASAGAISSAGTSPSSEKSMPASISAEASMMLLAPVARSSPSRPFNCRSAWRRCRSVSA